MTCVHLVIKKKKTISTQHTCHFKYSFQVLLWSVSLLTVPKGRGHLGKTENLTKPITMPSEVQLGGKSVSQQLALFRPPSKDFCMEATLSLFDRIQVPKCYVKSVLIYVRHVTSRQLRTTVGYAYIVASLHWIRAVDVNKRIFKNIKITRSIHQSKERMGGS